MITCIINHSFKDLDV